MKALWAAVRRQPVRAYVYGVLVPGEALAVSYGLVTGDQAALWMALAAAVLVVPGAEVARAKVTPVADPRDNRGRRLTASALPPPYDFRSPRDR